MLEHFSTASITKDFFRSFGTNLVKTFLLLQTNNL